MLRHHLESGPPRHPEPEKKTIWLKYIPDVVQINSLLNTEYFHSFAGLTQYLQWIIWFHATQIAFETPILYINVCAVLFSLLAIHSGTSHCSLLLVCSEPQSRSKETGNYCEFWLGLEHIIMYLIITQCNSIISFDIQIPYFVLLYYTSQMIFHFGKYPCTPVFHVVFALSILWKQWVCRKTCLLGLLIRSNFFQRRIERINRPTMQVLL